MTEMVVTELSCKGCGTRGLARSEDEILTFFNEHKLPMMLPVPQSDLLARLGKPQ